MSFLAPLGLALFALALPIILLWFLRQRREPMVVPTIFLWKKSVEEERVSPLIRNLTKSLLLLLQLITLLLLALAAAETVLNLRLSGSARRVIILIDRSASMGVVEEDGHARLDLVREQVSTLLSTFRGGDQAMLVAFDRRARVLSGFTDDTDALLRQVSLLTPLDAGTVPEEALRTAAGRAAALPPGVVEVFLFSDGAFPPLERLPKSLESGSFSFVGVGSEKENAGIVGLSLDTTLSGDAKLFVRVANAGSVAVERTLTLYRGDEVLDALPADIAPRSVGGTSFDLSPHGPGPIGVALGPQDALAADDMAFVLLEEQPMRRLLLVTDGNPLLERLRDFHPKLEVYSVEPDTATPDVGRFDLTVFDGFAPEGLVPGTGQLGSSAVWLGCVPVGGELGLGSPLKNPDIVDWDTEHPLNQNVDWSEIRLATATPVSGADDLTALVEMNGGPVVVALPGSGAQLVVGFKLEESSLPLRVAFPILFANILERACRHGATGEAGYLPAGDVLTRPLPVGAEEAVLRSPDGTETRVSAQPDGTVSWSETGRAGFYGLTFPGAGADEEERAVAVSFLSDSEVDIEPRPAVEIGGAETKSDPEAVEANYPLRKALIILALLVLALEWLLWLTGGRRRRKPADAVPVS